MEKVFVHRFKNSHSTKRKNYRKKLKQGKVILMERSRDGWLYGVKTVTEENKQ